ncbi:MAG: hypothetical protein ACOC79_03545, partial [Thermodesulfobacteriota bacterium]
MTCIGNLRFSIPPVNGLRLFLFLALLFLFSLAFSEASAAESSGPAAEAESRATSIPLQVLVVMQSAEVDTTLLPIVVEGNRSAENQIEQALLRNGFQVIDLEQVQRKRQLNRILLQNDPSAVGKLAGDLGADVVIHGQVRRTFVAMRQVMGRPTRFFSNEIRLKASDTRSGAVVYSGFETRPPSGAGATLPLENACQALLRPMMHALLHHTQQDRTIQPGVYHIRLSQVPFEALSGFVSDLKKIPGVDQVEINSFASRYAMLTLKYQGTGMELADQISRQGENALEITGVEADILEIRF